MPRPLSKFFSAVFAKQSLFIQKLESENEGVKNELMAELGYGSVQAYFEAALDYDSAIEGFRSFCGAKYQSLEDKGLFDRAQNFIGVMEGANQSYIEEQREQTRLQVKPTAEKQAKLWHKSSPISEVGEDEDDESNDQSPEYSEVNTEDYEEYEEYEENDVNQSFGSNSSSSSMYSYNPAIEITESEYTDQLQAYSGVNTTDYTDQSLDNNGDEYSAQENKVTDQNYQKSSDLSNSNDFIQQQINLFQQLVQSSLGSDFSSNAALNRYIQEATAAQDIFALLIAWLEEINGDNSNHNDELRQSISKALVTAYLLLDKPSLEDGSTYGGLLEFLLQQKPINENLLLDIFKLQVKIYLLADDNLDETKELLANFLNWEKTQDQKDVPVLSKDFFIDLRQLLTNINSYQQDGGAEFLEEFKGLNKAQPFFNDTFSNEDEEEQQQARAKEYFAFVGSYTKDLLLASKAVDLPLSEQAVADNSNEQNEQVVATAQSLPTDNLSEAERGKQEFVAKLLQDAKEITAKTSGQSRRDIDQLSTLLTEKYYRLENSKLLRKAFRADLVKNAAQGLVLNKTTLAQYLASAELNSNDKGLYVLMHYRFFLQIVKQHARKNTLEFVKAGNFAELGKLIKSIHIFSQKCAQSALPIVQVLAEQFQAQETAIITAWFNDIQTPDAYAQSIAILAQVASLQLPETGDAVAAPLQASSSLSKQLTTKDDYKKVIVPLLGLLNKDTEAFVTQQILSLAKLDLDKTLEVINAEKSGKNNKELINKLATNVEIEHLPSFQLLIRLYPKAAQLFATPQFAPTMQMVTALAMINQNDIHSPLLQLLKVAVAEKENELINKALLIFMALKKPSQEHHNEVVRLLTSYDKNYQKTLENFSYTQLNSFADYQALLCQVAKTKANEMNRELIVKLFDLAITKAKSADELLSLAPICRDNAELAERLANVLAVQFHQVEHLKMLMRRVNCPEAVAKIADAEIIKQISTYKLFTAKDYQGFIAQASYPNSVNSVVKSELVQKYFDLCQQSPIASDRAKYYSEFVRCLTGHQCLPWFVQSVLPQIVQNNLGNITQCEKLLELIEQQIAPQVSKSSELKDLLDKQRSIISDSWLKQLMVSGDQLVLSKEILVQRQILNGDEQAGDGQEFVELFNEAIKKVQQVKIPSLTELQQVNSLLAKLLAAAKGTATKVSSEYAELEKNYQKDVEALIQNQQTFIQELNTKLVDLTALRQQVENKKGIIFATLEGIKADLTKNKFVQLATNCQTYFDTVTQQFTAMGAATDDQLKQLTAAKDRQAADLQELIKLNGEKQLSPENMRIFGAKRQGFTETKKTTTQLTTEVQTQIEGAQQTLFAQAIVVKDSIGLMVTNLDQRHNQVSGQQIERQKQMVAAKHRVAEITLTLASYAERKSGIAQTMAATKTELGRKKAELTRLREDTLGPVSESIKQLSNTPEFKASLTKFVDVFKEAIEMRYVQQLGLWGRFRRAIALLIISVSGSPGHSDSPDSWKVWAGNEIDSPIRQKRYLPFRVEFAGFVAGFYTAEQCPKWVKEVMDDHNQGLPSEIDTLKTQLDRLEGTIQKLDQSSTAPQNQGTYASEIRDQVSGLFDVEKLLIRNDQRAPLGWRWLTNRALDKFLADNNQLKVDLKTLSDTQAGIDGLMVNNKALETQITNLEQQLSTGDFQSVDRLTEERDGLAGQLIELQKAQETDTAALNRLKQLHGQLEPSYGQIISLVSSPLIEILYAKGLNEDGKFKLLQEGIEKDKGSLLQEGMGDGIFANVVYHAVRHGTVAMLACILAALPEEHRRRYLATPIVNQGVPTTPLVLAIKLNDQAKIDCLIKNGADSNQRIADSNGNEMPLLLWAYQQNQSATVGSLIKAGVDQQAKDSKSNTLLHLAAAKGDEATIIRLLGNNSHDAVVDVNAKNQDGDDALALLMKSSVAAEKKYQLMQKLFARLSAPTRLKVQCFTAVDSEGNNFLHLAAAKGDLPLARFFLANPSVELLNAKNPQGKTPLELAAQAGQLDMVQFLLHQPIVLDGVQEVFLAALKQADTSENIIKVFLASHQVDLISDISAVLDGDIEFIAKKWTQKDQLQIKASSYRYLTACANLETMKLLVAHGADPSAIDELGSTVLHDAVLRGDFARVQYLIEECGVDPHPQNKARMTPLMALYQKGNIPEGTHRQVVSYLVEKTSNRVTRLVPGRASETLTQTDKDGNTLLHYVAKMGDIAVVDQLVQQKPYFGANPLNIQNNAGKTAAHLLVGNEALPEGVVTTILGFLFTKGKADLHIADTQGKTPLDYAQYLTVIEFLIAKLPEPLQEVKLMPMALQVMASESMSQKDKQQFIEGIAYANKMNIAKASYFYREVSYTHYNKKRGPSIGGLALAGANSGAILKNTYINSFNTKLANEKHDEFRFMVVGQKALEVACILDRQSPPSFPEELNQVSDPYLSLVENTTLSKERRNFWVRVVENREKKELTLQDYATGYTLLHALVWTNDKENLFLLNQAGVLYVTERDQRDRTVLMLVREKFAQEVKSQPSYTSIPTEGQSVYLSILQSIERRLLVEPQLAERIVAELDFSRLTELEMLVSLLGRLSSLNIKVECAEFLWQLTDRNGKSLAQSAIEVFNGLAKGLSIEDKKLPARELVEKHPDFVRCQTLLTNLLEASQMERRGRLSLDDKLTACRQQMEEQIKYFAAQEKYNYILSEAMIQLKVLNFGQQFASTTSGNVIAGKYNALCKESVQLHKATGVSRTNPSTGPFSSIFATAPAKEAPLTPRQLQENYAHNMAVYLGLFIEAAGIDTLVTLPSRSDAPCASLLKIAREQQLPSLYVEIVGRFLTQLGLTNPIELVQQTQMAAAFKVMKDHQDKVNRLHGATEVVPSIPVNNGNGLKITVGCN